LPLRLLVVAIIVRREFCKMLEDELFKFIDGILQSSMRARISANKSPRWAFCL